jgi:hypothetical protein
MPQTPTFPAPDNYQAPDLEHNIWPGWWAWPDKFPGQSGSQSQSQSQQESQSQPTTEEKLK